MSCVQVSYSELRRFFFLNQVGLIQELLQFGILVSSVEFLFLESPNFTVHF